VKYHDSMEMYLENIYRFELKDGQARVADIARVMGVSNPSVTKAMTHLMEEGMVIKESYGPVTLTESGRTRARKIYEKHQLITRFLLSTLELPPAVAEENACRMEHVLNGDMIEAIRGYCEKQQKKTIQEEECHGKNL